MLLLTADLLRAAGHDVVPFAVAEDRTLPTPVRDRLPPAAGSRARTRFGEAWAGTWSARSYRALAQVVDEVGTSRRTFSTPAGWSPRRASTHSSTPRPGCPTVPASG
jgi:hypothetical protein